MSFGLRIFDATATDFPLSDYRSSAMAFALAIGTPITYCRSSLACPVWRSALQVKSICVFCGASTGNDSAYAEAGRDLGAMMAERAIRLVFGGGNVGMMGLVADAVLGAGGEAVGVIPEHLVEREVRHDRLTELHVVDTMHLRKQKMFELSDAFAVLPGGIGTLDETFEVLTWRQLGLHGKPIVLLSAAGYWHPFQELVDAIVKAEFAPTATANLFAVAASPKELFELLDQIEPPSLPPDSTRF